MKQKTHKRLIQCPKCKENLRGIFYYNKKQRFTKLENYAYCVKDKKLFKIGLEVV